MTVTVVVAATSWPSIVAMVIALSVTLTVLAGFEVGHVEPRGVQAGDLHVVHVQGRVAIDGSDEACSGAQRNPAVVTSTFTAITVRAWLRPPTDGAAAVTSSAMGLLSVAVLEMASGVLSPRGAHGSSGVYPWLVSSSANTTMLSS